MQQTNIRSNSFIKKAVAILCVMFTILGLFGYFNIKSMNSNAASSYYFTVQGKSTSGYNPTFYNSSAVKYYCPYSWIHVTGTGRGSFSISVDVNNNSPLSVSSTRYGCVQFKNSSGGVVGTYNIYQDQPFIQLIRDQYSNYISAPKGSTGGFTLKYNCPFKLSCNSGYTIKNGSGYTVTSGGSYQSYGTKLSCHMNVVALNETNTTEKVVVNASRQGYGVTQSLSYTRVATPEINSKVTFKCEKGGRTYILQADGITSGDVKFTSVGDGFIELTELNCGKYIFTFNKSMRYASEILSAGNEELLDEGWSHSIGYAYLGTSQMDVYLYQSGDAHPEKVEKFTFYKQ